ncbi:MAG: DUF433 domain-containing protein [Chloroflexi bacterium]|nr:DUF433 domain-containing protein [Chloroflexota bacterium]
MTLPIEADPAPLRADADGTISVGQSRVLLDTIVTAFRLGESAEEIADNFPTLDLADVYAVIAYYLRHGPEVDAYMERRRQEAETVRAKLEQRHPPHELRKHLVARRDAAKSLPGLSRSC